MKTQYHQEITQRALHIFFDEAALKTIIKTNLGQDHLRYQIGHDHFHYDNNSFAAGDTYCYDLRLTVISAIKQGNIQQAREAFGKLTHTVQDLYAHSNYVYLWREFHPGLPSEEIMPDDQDILRDHRLQSGKLYYPLEVLSFFDKLKPYILPLLPRDSHAWMNIDDPSRPNFEYAFSAAIKHTQKEYAELAQKFMPFDVGVFTGLNQTSIS